MPRLEDRSMNCRRAAYFAAWIPTLAGLLCLTWAVGAESPPSNQASHWAFRPVQAPAIPAVRDTAWVHTPIDAFVLARLEAEGVKPAPSADKPTLLRRVTLDLIGLPPTRDEQKAFLEDASPQAFEKVVDGLLARPEYGERWARHWLDVVRYAETNGYERDGAKPNAWRYRDYVINAFNKDKPYDRFVKEQLAGDEVAGSNAEAMIAMTFLRLGTWDDEPADSAVDRCDQLDDMLGTTAAAFLGVTLRCARCHDHKFEPFAQKDYYAVLAVFDPLKRPQIGRLELDTGVGTPEEMLPYEQAQERWEAELEDLEKRVDALKNADGEEDRRLFSQLTAKIAALRMARPQGGPRAYIFSEDGPKAPVTHILRRGDPTKPAEEVGPAVPAVLVAQQPAPPTPTAKTTGRRLWLANWIASPENPLTARVMVNRVWQNHFGKGIVGTSNDFGVMGDEPTHPELLDWLADRFVRDGWSMKKLHRLIVLSSAYQTSSALEGGDPKGDKRLALFGRWRQRRLEAEAVRDSVLAVSGQLNPDHGGPSVYPTLPQAVLEGQSRPGEGWGKSDARQASRRSVYVFSKRALPVPELQLLDSPDTTSSCEKRQVSTTAPQALTFLNGPFLNEQAGFFAARLRKEAGDDAAMQVRRAFELALCRSPHPEELGKTLTFLETQRRQIQKDAETADKPIAEGEARSRALTAFCLVLLNTNEFVYLD
jgi:Protein of unknown function (DUF1553)/Protein of unknown function (DUF1549)